MNRIVRAALFLFVFGLSTRATAATIVSGDGELWYSTLASICGGAPSCSGSTVAVTPHPVWADAASLAPGASWVSYDYTGYGPDTILAPFSGSAENPDGTTPIIRVDESFNGAIGSLLSVTFWADDTADVYLNNALMFAANFTQAACAKGPIGCEADEFWTLNATLTQSQNVLTIVGYQIGNGRDNNSNPFGVLYSGTYEPAQSQVAQVPEPTALTLLGLGFTAVAMLARRRR